MVRNTSKNKLIVLLNFNNNYRGGAQKRYLSLFTYFQENNYDDYFLLMNESFLRVCVNDKIITNTKNIISLNLKYGNSNIPDNIIKINTNIAKTNINSIRKLLGSYSSFFKQFKSWCIFLFNLIKIIKNCNIGVIYGIFSGGVWSWPAAKLLRIKFIYCYMDASASMLSKSFVKIFNSEYYSLKYADKIDFLSEGILEKLLENNLKIKSGQISFSPNSFISYFKFQPQYPKEKRIVFSCRLTKYKNPHILLDAIHILKNEGLIDFEVIILGEGILLEELIERKNLLKIDNVKFLGGVPDTSLYLKSSKIFISIQSDNNYPSQSLLEAMACENAIIASDVGETRRIISNDVGILIDLNSDSLANAIKSLLSDPDRCVRLGRNARKNVMKTHNIENYSKYFLSITAS